MPQKSVLIITFAPATDSPRVRRQADALSRAGWKIHVAGYEGRAEKPSEWKLTKLHQAQIPEKESRAKKIFRHARVLLPIHHLLLARFFDRSARIFYWSKKYNRDHYETIKHAVEQKKEFFPSIVVAHDYTTAPIAEKLAREFKTSFAVDIHEYARDQYMHNLPWRLLMRPWVHRMQKIFLPKSAFNAAVCDGIADLLAADYAPMVRPTVLRNVPPKTEMSFRPTSEKITVLYHGILYPTRGLGLAVESLALWRPEFHLLIRGMGRADYLDQLQRQANALGVADRLTIEPPVKYNEIIPAANMADIGYFIHEDVSLQKRFTLPNKFFEYISAGLALCISDLPEMARLTQRYDLGKLVAGHSPDEIAAVINGFTRKSVDYYKKNSLIAAKELCWEKESSIMVEAYDRLV